MSLQDVLLETANVLVTRLGADACAISRVIGDVLIAVAEVVAAGRSLQSGQGYLASDFPETLAVLESGRPRMIMLTDANVDPSEARVLREFGFATLLMLRLDLSGAPWGLVEIYRVAARPFGDNDARLAAEILTLQPIA
jgi:GAF domain